MRSLPSLPFEREISPLFRQVQILLSLFAMSLLLAGCTSSPSGAAVPSPSAVSGGSAFPTDVQVSHDSFSVHAEPYLAINPRDTRNLLATAQVFDQQSERAPATFVSFDGGVIWHDNGQLTLPSGYTSGANIMVVFSPEGLGFIVARLDGPTRTGIFVWRTDDGGRHFRSPVALLAGNSTTLNVDHPWMAAGPAPGTNSSVLYVVWSLLGNQGGQMVGAVMFSRSFDAGQHFETPRSLTGSPARAVAVPVITAGPAARVSVVYLDYGPFKGQDQGAAGLQNGPMRVISSQDGGSHFDPAHAIGQDQVGSQAMLFALPQAAIDSSDGTLYVSFAAYRPGTRHSAIMLISSHDAGQTWTTPVMLDDASSSKQADQLLPQLLLNGSGTIFLSYFALKGGLVDVYLAQFTDHGRHFLSNRRISTTSWNLDQGVHVNTDLGAQIWIGDYQGLAAGPGVIYLLWNGARAWGLELFVSSVQTEEGHI